MDVQIIQKLPQQEKWVSIFFVDVQCQQFEDSITLKTNILYIVETIV